MKRQSIGLKELQFVYLRELQFGDLTYKPPIYFTPVFDDGTHYYFREPEYNRVAKVSKRSPQLKPDRRSRRRIEGLR